MISYTQYPIGDVGPFSFLICDTFAPACHRLEWPLDAFTFPPINLGGLFLNRLRLFAL